MRDFAEAKIATKYNLPCEDKAFPGKSYVAIATTYKKDEGKAPIVTITLKDLIANSVIECRLDDVEIADWLAFEKVAKSELEQMRKSQE